MYIYIYLYLLWFINQLSTVFGHHLVVVCATQQWPSQRQNETRGRNKLAPPVSFILGHLAVHLTIENRLNRSENRKKTFSCSIYCCLGCLFNKNQPTRGKRTSMVCERFAETLCSPGYFCCLNICRKVSKCMSVY